MEERGGGGRRRGTGRSFRRWPRGLLRPVRSRGHMASASAAAASGRGARNLLQFLRLVGQLKVRGRRRVVRGRGRPRGERPVRPRAPGRPALRWAFPALGVPGTRERKHPWVLRRARPAGGGSEPALTERSGGAARPGSKPHSIRCREASGARPGATQAAIQGVSGE